MGAALRPATNQVDIMTQMHAQTNKTVLDKYMKLDQGTRVQALYIWIDGTGEGLRSKTKTLEEYPNSVADLPIWNYDGSSCYQAEGSNSDTYLHPVKFYPDPFRGGKNIMVMCETYKYNKEKTETNKRKECAEVMEKAKHHDPWALTTAPSVPATSTAGTSSRLTTGPASTLVSGYPEPTPRLCPPNGSTKWGPLRASTWVMTSGSAATFSSVSLKTSASSILCPQADGRRLERSWRPHKLLH